VHNERCYLCREPLDLLSMEVDHIIPELLLRDPVAFESARDQLGLPADFDIQSFANWLPACRRCNTAKRSTVFSPSPLVQVCLQRAQVMATRAATLASKTVQNASVTRAWNTIKRAHAQRGLTPDLESAISEFLQYHSTIRPQATPYQRVILTPWLEVLSENGGIRLSRGPYGNGGGPVGPDVHPSFICTSCGSSAWNGARCVGCGAMDDD
jgi:hypothetical protein